MHVINNAIGNCAPRGAREVEDWRRVKH